MPSIASDGIQEIDVTDDSMRNGTPSVRTPTLTPPAHPINGASAGVPVRGSGTRGVRAASAASAALVRTDDCQSPALRTPDRPDYRRRAHRAAVRSRHSGVK